MGVSMLKVSSNSKIIIELTKKMVLSVLLQLFQYWWKLKNILFHLEQKSGVTTNILLFHFTAAKF